MSAGCLSNVCPSSSPYKMMINEGSDHTQINPIQKQGFLSILNTTTPDFNSLSYNFSHPPNYSIRRTFSADMLALDQNGFSSSSLKRAQSSEQLSFLGGDDDHQEINNKYSSSNDEKKGAFEDIWSSIQKNGGSGSGSGSSELPPPYVHPLVKRSASLLSQKSLEICTESLGSETGSETGLDGLLASDPGGNSDKDREDHVHEQQVQDESNMINHGTVIDDHEKVGAKCTKLPSIRRTSSSPPVVPMPMPRSSFPPPLPSLSHREGSYNLHMRSHRGDGRLVLEAVSVPSVNRLRAQRHDGRLLLVFANDHHNADNELTLENDSQDYNDGGEDKQSILEENAKELNDHDQEDDEEEEEEKNEVAIVMDTKTTNFKTTSSPSLIMSKLMELTTTKNNSSWPRNFNTTIVKTLESDKATLAKSPQLPPRPVRLGTKSSSTATVLNAYEYYWRRGSTVAVLKPLASQQNNAGAAGSQVVKDAYRNKVLLGHRGGRGDVVVVKAAGGGGGDGVHGEKGGLKAEEYLVPLLRGCKEPRKRSLLFWDSEPYCIATS